MCTVKGDNETSIQWQIGGRNVTGMSSNHTNIDEQIISYLYYNYTTTFPEVISNCDFICSDVTSSQERCSANISCLVVRNEFIELKGDLEVVVEGLTTTEVDNFPLIVSVVLAASLIGFVTLMAVGAVIGLCC